MKLNHFLTPHTKIKWIKDLHVRYETIKFLKENTDSNLLDIGFSNIFLDLSPQAKGNKSKINNWDYIKLKKLLQHARN